MNSSWYDGAMTLKFMGSLREWPPVLAVPFLVALSYNSQTVAPASSDSSIMIQCDGSTRSEPEECGPWGDAILAAGSPGDNVDMSQITRLEIGRALWGYIDHCTVQYYVEGIGDSVYEADVGCL